MKVDEDAKILALTFFSGRPFNLYVNLRTAIITNLDDKFIRVDDGAKFINLNDEHGAEFYNRARRASGEVVTRLPCFSSSGKAKARASKNKEACWNCGESDHHGRDCPND